MPDPTPDPTPTPAPTPTPTPVPDPASLNSVVATAETLLADLQKLKADFVAVEPYLTAAITTVTSTGSILSKIGPLVADIVGAVKALSALPK